MYYDIVVCFAMYGLCMKPTPGKSDLLYRFRELLQEQEGEERSCCYISGKFEQHVGFVPFSAIASAFSQLVETIQQRPNSEQIIRELNSAIRCEERAMITSAIPSLKPLFIDVRITKKSAWFYNAFAVKQLEHVIRQFLRAVARVLQPLVFCIDDLHFADAPSLDLIRAFITDAECSPFLLIATYREIEIMDAHPLVYFLGSLGHCVANIHQFELHNLTRDQTSRLVFDLTDLEEVDAVELGNFIFDETRENQRGCPLFIIRFLRILKEKGFLRLCEDNQTTWEWRTDCIDQIGLLLNEDLIEIISEEITRLPIKTQTALKIASCLSSHFDLGIVAFLLQSFPKVDLDDYLTSAETTIDVSDEAVAILKTDLQEAVKLGLIQEESETRYRFEHDRIQQASYCLIPEGSDNMETHFKLGKLLYSLSQKHGEEWMFLVAVNQLNRGSALIMDREVKNQLVLLNLQAAKRSMKASAFVPASDFLQQGYSLLESKGKWKKQYALSLELSSTLARVSWTIRDFVTCKHMVDEVIQNAVTQQDKMDVYFTLLQSLGLQSRFEEAHQVGLQTLAMLGVRVKRNNFRLKANILSLRPTVMSTTMEKVDKMPVMVDENKLLAMKILRVLIVLALLQNNADAFMHFQCLVIRLTLKHGIATMSSFAYASFGMVLAALGNFNEAFRLGELSLQMAAKYSGDSNGDPYTQMMHYTFIHYWKRPFSECMRHLLRAYNSAMLDGQVDAAFSAASAYVAQGIAGGAPLRSLIPEAKKLAQQLTHFESRGPMLYLILPALQLTLNLAGFSKNPLRLSGEIMQDEVLVRECYELQYDRAVLKINHCRILLAYFFGDFSGGYSMMESSINQDVLRKEGSHSLLAYVLAVKGLLFVEHSRLCSKKKSLRKAEKINQLMRKWYTQGATSIFHFIALLKAEITSVVSPTSAKRAFEEAISAAKKNEAIHIEAMANERAAIFYLNANNMQKAIEYMIEARRLYTEWGAICKVDYLKENYAYLFYDQQSVSSSKKPLKKELSAKFTYGSLYR